MKNTASYGLNGMKPSAGRPSAAVCALPRAPGRWFFRGGRSNRRPFSSVTFDLVKLTGIQVRSRTWDEPISIVLQRPFGAPDEEIRTSGKFRDKDAKKSRVLVYASLELGLFACLTFAQLAQISSEHDQGTLLSISISGIIPEPQEGNMEILS
jgi:hypothetical protein